MSMIVNQSMSTYSYDAKYVSSAKETDKTGFKEASGVKKESIVEEYCKRKPENASVMKRWMNTGKKVQKSYGISEVNREDMPMSEYKSMICSVIGSIPFDMTRPYDEESVIISDEGWEAMKNDPDYEAWVLGHIKENRDVKNPFFGMGDMGCYGVQKFGAKIEDREGYCYSKIYGGTAAGAKSMFNSQSAGADITTRAPKADLQPPKDYNLWEERAKEKRARQRKERQKMILDAAIEAQIEYRTRMNEMWSKKYYEQMNMKQRMYGQDFSNGISYDLTKLNMTSNSPSGSKVAELMSAYEAGTISRGDLI